MRVADIQISLDRAIKKFWYCAGQKMTLSEYNNTYKNIKSQMF